MLTFLAAMMAVFFDDTSSATRISISSILLILLVMITLLLYLERDGTVSDDDSSPYTRLYRLLAENIQAWVGIGEKKLSWLRMLRRNKSRCDSSKSVDETSDTSSGTCV